MIIVAVVAVMAVLVIVGGVYASRRSTKDTGDGESCQRRDCSTKLGHADDKDLLDFLNSFPPTSINSKALGIDAEEVNVVVEEEKGDDDDDVDKVKGFIVKEEDAEVDDVVKEVIADAIAKVEVVRSDHLLNQISVESAPIETADATEVVEETKHHISEDKDKVSQPPNPPAFEPPEQIPLIVGSSTGGDADNRTFFNLLSFLG